MLQKDPLRCFIFNFFFEYRVYSPNRLNIILLINKKHWWHWNLSLHCFSTSGLLAQRSRTLTLIKIKSGIRKFYWRKVFAAINSLKQLKLLFIPNCVVILSHFNFSTFLVWNFFHHLFYQRQFQNFILYNKNEWVRNLPIEILFVGSTFNIIEIRKESSLE